MNKQKKSKRGRRTLERRGWKGNVMKSIYCCQCGEALKPHEQKMQSYLVDAGIIHTLDYRSKATNPEAFNELYPQLLATAHIWRNGGSGDSTHICRGCIAVGLRKLKEIIDATLEEFERISNNAVRGAAEPRTLHGLVGGSESKGE